ncbi:MAG: histidinol dehydrogenase [Gammaproteobacteria bacterium]|nr:histidinol dehydrogenase [Gammaproteobacteria bacterium]
MLAISQWQELSTHQQQGLLQRPPVAHADTRQCQQIVEAVRARGDQALLEFTERFDGVQPESLRVPVATITGALEDLEGPLKHALLAAHRNIRGFHAHTLQNYSMYEPAKGVQCEVRLTPVPAVGLYIPGGTAPLPSTVLMLGVPAELAGCPRRILCTPPQNNGRVDPLVLAAAALCNIDHVYAVGGAQAIAAMAYGTATVPKVHKIFGPGNPWVTRAKQIVALDPSGAGCDMPAGPSEVLVIADAQANPEFIAADLLSQAEHGEDSQVLLVTPCLTLAKTVQEAVVAQLTVLGREEIARKALTNSRIIITESLRQALAVSNDYAPEHLIINTAAPRDLLPGIENAGSVFLGPWSPESVGDYCSGTNHVLPTNGYASHVSGVSVADFQKRITVQQLDQKGLQEIGWIAETLARAEGLDAHANAVTLRSATAPEPA